VSYDVGLGLEGDKTIIAATPMTLMSEVEDPMEIRARFEEACTLLDGGLASLGGPESLYNLSQDHRLHVSVDPTP
jgi:hypothetical protein